MSRRERDGATRLDRAIVRLLPLVPKPLVRRVASGYIAGPTLSDAIRVVRSLNSADMIATIDVLGEEVTNAGEAAALVEMYHDVLSAIDQEGLTANISIKPTALGLRISYELCLENLMTLLAQGCFVRLDMEDSTSTDPTLRLYREFRERGYSRLGIVLQSRLRRTLNDVRNLADIKPNVRLCKGIYLESREVAYPDAEDIRESFVRCLDALLSADARVAVATHDERLIRASLERRVPEFQMLLGVRSDRALELVAAGQRVRIYVPFGEQWYAYSVRRLVENPSLATTIARAAAARSVEPVVHRVRRRHA